MKEKRVEAGDTVTIPCRHVKGTTSHVFTLPRGHHCDSRGEAGINRPLYYSVVNWLSNLLTIKLSGAFSRIILTEPTHSLITITSGLGWAI